MLNQFALIPLAGPANKQARIASDNIILGNKGGINMSNSEEKLISLFKYYFGS